jgi:glycosyltransferase involved in cell wall biosynthesis
MSSPSISGFTFIRNGVSLCFPFEESIRSLLPLVDEYIIAVGQCNDGTLERIQAINDPKIRIIQTIWNDRMKEKGFVYAQQKMIAQYSCVGDWAFYLEADELIHEKDILNIRKSVEHHHENLKIEALVFDYFHFYGTQDWIADSPAWYRRECRLIRNTIRSYAPDGQYWLITKNHKKGRNPIAALANAHIYHYGWVRNKEAMNRKLNQVNKFWSKESESYVEYSRFDARALKPFTLTHPQVILQWLNTYAEKELRIEPNYIPTSREKRHRILMVFEKLLNLDFSRKHFKLLD